MKLIVKGAVLAQDGTLTVVDVDPVRSPALVLVDTLVTTLENPASSRDFEGLGDLIQQCSNALTPVLAGKMKAKNANRLPIVASYLASEEFLQKFIHDPMLSVEREAVLQSIRTMMSPFQQEMREAKKFHLTRLVARRDRLRYTMSSATVQPFLLAENTRNAFQAWVMEAHPGDGRLVPFILSCQDFARISARNLLRDRARRIYSKFLEKRSTDDASGRAISFPSARVDVSSPAVQRIADAIDADQIGRDLFAEAVDEALEKLNDMYNGEFKTSSHYQKLVQEVEGISARIHVQRTGMRGRSAVTVREAAASKLPSESKSEEEVVLNSVENGPTVALAVTEDGLVLNIEDEDDFNDDDLLADDE
uniref:RGS domain-containing protein n=1 Tax=Pinguiococcus pyrenoidosus TaxID=172671 RepID=A0A7R9YFC7_9STRA|mmetsp:Transcript_8475/g.31903  ORF Transcript_8475/g.31903 Transcript_8475/m.31903 type:complete len:364 (+) Transcript_8475:326-1417(+)